ncbi:MAG: guanylate kinase [cyanobacterium endosymbiont of Rhopalodia musculus]|uniref:guanylate kinase n=1 Tax=cyanobacterium endosymbiont of Epithemia clementina EcSB TaxID=3034674 RepID=UPI0024810C8D|nr:guanylate kinase [cyanobacterium endosymbiont of Epithemia clementina EcSB]WGT67710.1 guanylate kinase [cyanobacterium endosymbiont of Epithemia clementina EcSB]
MSSGQLIVLTGPSGVGKGTLVRSLLARHNDLYLSISATTRSPRRGEVDGKDYHFVTRSQFEEMIYRGELLEWAEYADNCYGTPRFEVEKKINLGTKVLLEIDVVGARNIKQTFPDALRIFILPPSLEELERRLRKRGKDSQEAITCRLKRAKEELTASGEFNHTLINDDLDQTLQKFESLILAV